MVYVVTFHLYLQRIPALLNYDEIKMSFDLMKELGIRQCILVQNEKNDGLVNNFKNFSSINIPITYLNYYSLDRYIKDVKAHYSCTGLLFKEKNLYKLEKISVIFGEISISKQKHCGNNTKKKIPV